MCPAAGDPAPVQPKEIGRYVTSGGVRIYSIPIQSFPNHYTNVYLVLAGDTVGMIDVGSGWGESNTKLVKGLEGIHERYQEKITLSDVSSQDLSPFSSPFIIPVIEVG